MFPPDVTNFSSDSWHSQLQDKVFRAVSHHLRDFNTIFSFFDLFPLIAIDFADSYTFNYSLRHASYLDNHLAGN